MMPNPERVRATVRRATSADANAIERLLRASDLPTDGVSELIAASPHEFVVAVTGDDVVGAAGLEVCCDDALLRSVAVDSQWRSAGVGKQLVETLVSNAESRGIRAMYLLTMTAEHYFPRFQFERVDRASVPETIANTDEFKSVCCSTAAVMRRTCATH